MANKIKYHTVIVLNKRGQDLFDAKYLCLHVTKKQLEKIEKKLQFSINLIKELDYDCSFRLYDSVAGFRNQEDADDFIKQLENGQNSFVDSLSTMERM